METTVRVKKYTCDNCGDEQLVEKDDFPPFYGYKGSVEIHLSTGGGGGNWFACKFECIEGAINKAVFDD